MAISNGIETTTLEEILQVVSEEEIINYYLSINRIPTVINSPIRRDSNPSFGIFYNKRGRVKYIDFSTKESGSIYDLLKLMWHCSYPKMLSIIKGDIKNISKVCVNNSNKSIKSKNHNNDNNTASDLQCKIRKWKDYDIKYWGDYGISLKWLKYAEVYPISHKIIIKNGYRYIFAADKYAYAYVEHKEGKTTLKIYQPFNKKGYKWCNKHDASTISLWTKVPDKGDIICICSSLKDALCLWANTGIPSIAIQGEGYNMSNTAISELRKRFKSVFICLDNDEPGLKDGKSLGESTKFTNIILPPFKGGKDISDLRKAVGKVQFKTIIYNLFKEKDYSGDN
jgi:hypothetical protein